MKRSVLESALPGLVVDSLAAAWEAFVGADPDMAEMIALLQVARMHRQDRSN